MASTEKCLRNVFLAGALMLAACGGADTTTTLPGSTTGVSTTTSAGATTTVTTAITTAPTTTGVTSTSTSTSTSGPPTTTSTTVAAAATVDVAVTVADGEASGPGRVTVPLGGQLRLTVSSDEIDEVHFHGYDVFADVAPGAPAVMLLVADIPGVFEVELEGRGLELVIVEVK